ncbi:hypothetical protein SDC9_194583 [bioreactor metagenome]|uniref:Uncharacterized protein n=1 Tax=bioreactor metagenome TaxID=1076179 RepID=A0A645IFA8_9ZZZZ
MLVCIARNSRDRGRSGVAIDDSRIVAAERKSSVGNQRAADVNIDCAAIRKRKRAAALNLQYAFRNPEIVCAKEQGHP